MLRSVAVQPLATRRLGSSSSSDPLLLLPRHGVRGHLTVVSQAAEEKKERTTLADGAHAF